MDNIFFDSWSGLARTGIVGVLAYLAIVILLRVSGKRTLSQWNAFDFIVTVALGSTLASAILSRDVPLMDGVLAFSVLIFCQLVVTWLSVRSRFVRRSIKNTPALLLYQGEYLHDVMKYERVSAAEIRAALRAQGIGAVEDVGAVVLETDGRFSVVRDLSGGISTLQDVRQRHLLDRN